MPRGGACSFPSYEGLGVSMSPPSPEIFFLNICANLQIGGILGMRYAFLVVQGVTVDFFVNVVAILCSLMTLSHRN